MADVLAARSDLVAQMADFRFYYYKPSMAAAIIFAVLFGLATLAHSCQMVRWKTWFMIPFVVGGLFEMVGYIGRIMSATENPGPYDKIPYIIQSLLLLVAPPFFAASIYMELGRIVVMVDGEDRLLIRRSWLTRIQATGSSMMASEDPDKVNFAHYAVIAGLFLQVAFFGFFVFAATIFHSRMVVRPTSLAHERPWTKQMIGLYIVSTLILVRSVVRGIEFIQGYDGYIMTHEAFLYGFDAVLMFLAVVTINIIHPGEAAEYLRDDAVVTKKAEYQQLQERYADVEGPSSNRCSWLLRHLRLSLEDIDK